MTHRFVIPTPRPAEPAADAFVRVPLSGLPTMSADQAAHVRALYEWAFAEAKAVVAPSIVERDLAGVWN